MKTNKQLGNNIVNIGTTNSFGQYDKAMGIVTDVLGDELTDEYNISVMKGVCKITLPMSVPLDKLCGRDDVTVTFGDSTSMILVH